MIDGGVGLCKVEIDSIDRVSFVHQTVHSLSCYIILHSAAVFITCYMVLFLFGFLVYAHFENQFGSSAVK